MHDGSRMGRYHVYILANAARRTYTGITSDLVQRLGQHLKKDVDTYIGRFGITTLVHVESYEHAFDAIQREKQIKRWSRAKKHALIEAHNPQWRDLTRDAHFARMLS
jgi:putative endonuclease